MERRTVSPKDVARYIQVRENIYDFEQVRNLRSTLAMPSYVNSYSLAIEYMYNWFKAGFDKDFFRGGIYIDGKNVLDDYKRLNEYAMRNIVKGENPRARIEPSVQYDYDRDGVDLYQAPPEIYLKRSNFQQAFFKDFDRNLFFGFALREMRMDFNFKVRVNTKSQQLDTYNRMELYFRNGATQKEFISVDIHVPKDIVLDIARKAGFEVRDGEVVAVIEFINYMNLHSTVPFLFKIRAINQKMEYFIRISDLYTHIAVKDKLQVDSGETDGKLSFNYAVEMAAVLSMPVPHYFTYYSADDNQMGIKVERESDKDVTVGMYSISIYDIPKTNELGWNRLANTDYQLDKGDTEIDLSPLFDPTTPIGKIVNHQLTKGLSPSKFLDIRLIRDDDIAKYLDFEPDWEHKVLKLMRPAVEEVIHIIIYSDNVYINEITAELEKYNENRISSTKHNSN